MYVLSDEFVGNMIKLKKTVFDTVKTGPFGNADRMEHIKYVPIFHRTSLTVYPRGLDVVRRSNFIGYHVKWVAFTSLVVEN